MQYAFMKESRLSKLLPILMVISGCVSSPGTVTDTVLGPVGPAQRTVSVPSSTGTLVVFSELETRTRVGSDDLNHSNYDIYASDGRKLRHVVNYVTPVLEEPASVSLAPGSYIVKTRAPKYGRVAVSVIIEVDKTTAIYLDGTDLPSKQNASPSQLVSLPNGKVIGWSATPQVH